MRYLLTLVVLALTVSIADAGPVLRNMRERRIVRHSSYSIQQSYSYSKTVTTSGCTNGVCPIK